MIGDRFEDSRLHAELAWLKHCMASQPGGDWACTAVVRVRVEGPAELEDFGECKHGLVQAHCSLCKEGPTARKRGRNPHVNEYGMRPVGHASTAKFATRCGGGCGEGIEVGDTIRRYEDRAGEHDWRHDPDCRVPRS